MLDIIWTYYSAKWKQVKYTSAIIIQEIPHFLGEMNVMFMAFKDFQIFLAENYSRSLFHSIICISIH